VKEFFIVLRCLVQSWRYFFLLNLKKVFKTFYGILSDDMITSGIFSIFLLTAAVSASVEMPSENGQLPGRQRFQEIVNLYLQDFYTYMNNTIDKQQDVEVLSKGKVDDDGQLSLPLFNRSKASDYFVKSNVGELTAPSVKTHYETHIDSDQYHPSSVTSQLMSPTRNPAVAFNVYVSRQIYHFEVERDVKYPYYYINIVVEKMICSGNTGNVGQSPQLSIRGVCMFFYTTISFAIIY